jgi:hypothetical protein
MEICVVRPIGTMCVLLHCGAPAEFGCGEFASVGTAQSWRAVAGLRSIIPGLSRRGSGTLVK